MNIATSPAQLTEICQQASAVRFDGAEAQLLDVGETLRPHMLLNPEASTGRCYFTKDGRGSSTNTTTALARGATQRGAKIYEGVTVTGVIVDEEAVRGVRTSVRDLAAEYFVNAAGMWRRDLAAMAGVDVPLQALAHYYVVTEAIDGLPCNLGGLAEASDESG